MNKTTSRFILLFGMLATSLAGFMVSESFGYNDLQKLQEERQNAVDEQIKFISMNDETSAETAQEEKYQSMTIRESMNDKSVNSVNAVKINTVFSFADKVKEINSFNIFKQISGFDREGEATVFMLQGVVGIDKSLLYRAADSEFSWGGAGIGLQHKYSEFGVVVTLEQGEFPIRTFNYRICTISNYSIDTLHDFDESYSKASTFVIVDNFEFTCHGYEPSHYDYEDYIEKHGIDAVMEMEQMEMGAMTPEDYNKQ